MCSLRGGGSLSKSNLCFGLFKQGGKLIPDLPDERGGKCLAVAGCPSPLANKHAVSMWVHRRVWTCLVNVFAGP